jgi:hypothetical protein
MDSFNLTAIFMDKVYEITNLEIRIEDESLLQEFEPSFSIEKRDIFHIRSPYILKLQGKSEYIILYTYEKLKFIVQDFLIDWLKYTKENKNFDSKSISYIDYES